MQDSDLLLEGFQLMLMGMGFVFVFLTLLVAATTLMSKGINHFFPAPEEPAQGGSNSARAPVAKTASGQNSEVVAAISAAIHLHRQRK